MGRFIYGMLVSLDGYIEGPNQDLSWHQIDDEFHAFANDQERQTGTLLYGRRMWEIMHGFWSTADRDPDQPDVIHDYARIWQSKPKVVVSTTLERVEGNARLLQEHVAEELTRLKEESDGVISVGGACLAETCMRLGLIDEYHLYLQPVILGRGTPMFPQLAERINLRLAESRTFASGATFLRFVADSGNGAVTRAIPLPERLANPARRALAGAGITHLGQLAGLPEADIAQLHGMGPKALGQLRDALAEHGLSFAEQRSR